MKQVQSEYSVTVFSRPYAGCGERTEIIVHCGSLNYAASLIRALGCKTVEQEEGELHRVLTNLMVRLKGRFRKTKIMFIYEQLSMVEEKGKWPTVSVRKESLIIWICGRLKVSSVVKFLFRD